ncbi:hypothetical protein ABEB36_010528 [Hypothenemus hampei]|uniref:PXA domain-containing protein n=1 Tax=Hypothenemus hampei TaxID=57062 RepID=A0ABD1EK19_HYPHA
MSVSEPFYSSYKFFLVSLLILTVPISINFFVTFLPVGGLILVVSVLLIWFLSLCVTFVALHKLLQRKDPIPNCVFNKYLKYVGVSHEPALKNGIPIKANAQTIKRLTLDIDKYFISNWYCSISADINFTLESKVFLEEVLIRFMDMVATVNQTSVMHGVLNIFLKHLKEFRRSLKRKEKYNVGIEELYRYSHICSDLNNKTSKSYFLHHLTISLLHRFINSELWNSLPCHILVSLLARKLVCYLLDILSNPEVLNCLILNCLASNEIKNKIQLQNYGRISIEEFFDVIDKVNVQKDENVTANEATKLENRQLIEKAQELQKKVEAAAENFRAQKEIKIQDEINATDSVILRRREKRKKSRNNEKNPVEKSPRTNDPVKIYEPKNAVKTWRDSRDLACVSLGQDPLDALLDTPDSGGKVGPKSVFWEITSKSEEPKHESPPSTTGNLFTEVIHIPSMEGLKTSLSDATERTLHNIKDLQETTMNSALHKIGDFQDEAAGVVEGILDFGRAGFRKGLRLTGLQDNIEIAKPASSSIGLNAKTSTKSMRNQVKKKLEEFKKVDSEGRERTSSAESADAIWINPLQSDSPNEELLTLEKCEDIDQNPSSKLDDLSIPSISTEDASGTNSPDPEYEDTADLASSIAKLRSLLQQRSSESSLSTPALSPMPDDYNVVHKAMEQGSFADIEAALETDGMMTNFYKACTKTASGVLSNTLNTIKTALPISSTDSTYTVELWKFTANTEELDSLVRMIKLLSERKQYCLLDKEIDTAYDALDSVDFFQQTPKLIPNLKFDDELEDFEGKIPMTKAIVDILSELLSDTNSPLIQEPIIKAVLLLFGPVTEDKITAVLNNAMEYLAENLVTIPEKTNSTVLTMDIEEYVKCIEKSTLDFFKYFVGRDNFRTVLKLFISSLQKTRINQDVLLQSFEFIAMKLIQESTLTSPPASA